MDGGPHTGSASGSKSHLLNPEQRSARAPQLLNHPALVEVQHIGVMCAARYSQRAQRQGAHLTSQLAMAARPRSASRHDLVMRFGVLLREEKDKNRKNCPLL